MGKDTPQSRTLTRALEIIGNADTLARLLRCEVTSLTAWLSADEPTPTDVYLQALDIVSGHSPPGAKNGSL